MIYLFEFLYFPFCLVIKIHETCQEKQLNKLSRQQQMAPNEHILFCLIFHSVTWHVEDATFTVWMEVK